MQTPNHKIRRPSDSFFTNLFARSISVHISPLLARTKITPLQVTIVGLTVGIFAAWVGSNPIWSCGLIAAVLIEISHILDCVDGELARLTDRGNLFAASLDPISDRIKDIAMIYSAYLQSLHFKILNLSEFKISTIALLTVGLWFLYMYIVDAFLNPAKKKNTQKTGINRTRIYLGLYDLFIYGSIIFWILHH